MRGWFSGGRWVLAAREGGHSGDDRVLTFEVKGVARSCITEKKSVLIVIV